MGSKHEVMDVDLSGSGRLRALAAKLALLVAVALLALGTWLMIKPHVTDVVARRAQQGLQQSLGGTAGAGAYASGSVKTADPLIRLEIPTLGVDVVVVEGTTLEALRAGAGHYPGTPYPGARGNSAIAGHRTTYGAPFRDIDEMTRGQTILLTTPLERLVYEVTREPWVVDDTDWSPIERYPDRGSFLTLTSCSPEGSAESRIVVRARLVQRSSIRDRAATTH